MRQGRRFILITLVTPLLALGALVLLAGPAAAIPGVDCNETHYRVLFWPKGHKAVKSAGFPVFAPPHTEVYAGTGKTYADTQQKGYVDATAGKTATTGCTAADTGAFQKGSLKKQSTKQVLLVCAFPKSPMLVGAAATSGGGAFLINLDGKPVVSILIKTAGSKLTWDPAYCKSKKSPK